MLLLLNLGCSFGLSTPGRVDPASVATRIDSITPAAGPPSGGTEVTIEGAGFTGDVTVAFGGVFGEVTVEDAGTLTAVTPALGAELVVDVVVSAENGEDTLAGGFAYRRRGSSGGDTGGDGADSGGPDLAGTGGTYAGMVGGTALFELSDHACPTCFGLEWGAPPTVTSTVFLHPPTDGSWWSWLPASGACLTGVSPNTLATTGRDAGAALVLNDGTRDLSLSSSTGSGGTTYASSGFTTAEYTTGGTWALAAPGGADLERFVLDDAIRTPLDFTSIEPASLLNEASTAAFATPIGSADGTPISWAPTGMGDFVLIVLEASNASGQLGTTTCRTPDDGVFVIPASAVGSWPTGSRLAVRIQRYLLRETVLPDGSTLESAGRIERIGTGAVFR